MYNEWLWKNFVGKGATLFWPFWPFSGGEFQTNLYIWSKLMAAHFSAGYDDLGNCKVCKKSFKVSFYHNKKEFQDLTLLVEPIMYTNCSFLFLFKHSEQFMYRKYSDLGISMYWSHNSMNNLLSYCVSWCKNKCFWKRSCNSLIPPSRNLYYIKCLFGVFTFFQKNEQKQVDK